MGRKKIEMKLVKESCSRQVTFSKRRNGIFKKAHELATLCAIEILLVIFSPGGKPYSFGHPSVDSVMERFSDRDESNDGTDSQDETTKKARKPRNGINDMNNEFSDLLDKLKKEKERGDVIKASKAASSKGKGKALLSVPIKKLSREELRCMQKEFGEIYESLIEQSNMLDAADTLLELAKEPVLASDLPNAK